MTLVYPHYMIVVSPPNFIVKYRDGKGGLEQGESYKTMKEAVDWIENNYRPQSFRQMLEQGIPMRNILEEIERRLSQLENT